MSKANVSLPKGTHLFSIHFSNVQSILAIPIAKETILKKASFNQNILNFTFIDTLTKLIGNIGKRMIQDEKVQNVNKMNQRQNKARLCGHRHCNRDTSTQTLSTQALKPSPKRLEANKEEHNSIDRLSADQEQTALNAAFLLQALIKKDFGLKPTDIRSMQLHDRRLAKEITNLELPENTANPNSKFKLISGILYHSSQTGTLKLCVSPIIAESVAYQLHNDAIFH